MTFNEYVVDWFRTKVETATDVEVTELFDVMGYYNMATDVENKREFLMERNSGQEIYEKLFCLSKRASDSFLNGEQCTLLADIFDQAISEMREQYDYVDELINDMTDECNGYNDPMDFFKDLAYGGCKSGMVGMFIYNCDCKEFYIKHIDDMESFVEDFENGLGEPITNRDKLPHYTFICWLCYEELAYRIAKELWPDEF